MDISDTDLALMAMLAAYYESDHEGKYTNRRFEKEVDALQDKLMAEIQLRTTSRTLFGEALQIANELRNHVPKVGVAIIVHELTGKVLIAKRREDMIDGGRWEFPGGKKLSGEGIEQCVEREIKEELGVEIEVGPHYISMEVKRQHGKFELCFYFARIIGPYTALKCIECSAWEWIFIDQIKATRCLE